MYAWIEVLPGIAWLLSALLAVLLLQWDKRRAAERAYQNKTVDFQERGLRAYLIGALLIGTAVVVPYFWITRKGWRGLAIGCAALGGIVALAMGVTSAMGSVMWSAYEKEVHEACSNPDFPDRSYVCGAGSSNLYNAGLISPDEERALLASGCTSGDDFLCTTIAPGFEPEDVRQSLRE